MIWRTPSLSCMSASLRDQRRSISGPGCLRREETMMSKPGSKTLLCILLLVLFCAAKWAGPLNVAQSSGSEAQTNDMEVLKSELSRYKTWTLVNPKPVLLDRLTSFDCAALNIGAGNPHSSKYISVYVNDAGRAAMMSELYPKFPQGSIIVKAKFSEENNGVPELLTIMVK